jgi:hypothetical protein
LKVMILVIWAGAILVVSHSIQLRVRSINLLEKVGDYSYSIYLVHYPLLSFVYYQPFASNSLVYPLNEPHKLTIFLFLLVCLSYFLRNYIELSNRHSINLLKPLVLTIIIVLLLTFFPNFNVKRIQLSPKQYSISNSVLDYAPYRCGKKSRLISPLADTCKLNNLSSPSKRILLIGDSHADMQLLQILNSVSGGKMSR